MKSSPLRLIISVTVTCVVAALGLAMTYQITAPRIAAGEKAAEQDALAAVLAGATQFEAVAAPVLEKAQTAAGESSVLALYIGRNEAGDFVGWGLKVASRGYGGPISLVLGLDRDGKVVGLTILTMNETPGLGSRIQTEPGFLAQFKSLPGDYSEKDVKALDMISGATKSSRGVRDSIVAAGAVYADVLAGQEVSR